MNVDSPPPPTLSCFNTIHSCINNAIHKHNSGKFNSVSIDTECAKIFHFCSLKEHVYLGPQKLSCVHIIVKNLNTHLKILRAASSHPSKEVYVFRHDVYYWLWNKIHCIISVVVQSWQSSWEEKITGCYFSRLSFISLWGICFQSIHNTIQKGRFFWMKRVLS